MSEILAKEDQPIAIFNPFRAQLAELVESNSKRVFDYTTAKGEKEVRSYIYTLRQTKTAVDNARKGEGEISRGYVARVNEEGNDIIADIQLMIDTHDKPLKEAAQKEADRKSSIEAKVNNIISYITGNYTGITAAEIRGFITELSQLQPNETFDEYMAEATRQFSIATTHLKDLLSSAIKYEADQVELTRLREISERRDREERETAIALEATQKATADAEKKSADDLAAETKRADDAEKATQDAADLVEKNRLALIKKEMDDEAAELAEEARRLANTRHVGAVRKAAKEAIIHCSGCTDAQAKEIVRAIHGEFVPNITIKY